MKIGSIEDVHKKLEEITDAGDLWHRERYQGPSAAVLRDINHVLECIWNDMGLLPERVVQTVEEGIYVDYRVDGFDVILELYNAGEGAALFMKDGEIRESVDIPRLKRSDETCRVMKSLLKI